MGAYMVKMQRTAAAANSLGNAVADATRPRRLKVCELSMGSEATPADAALLWHLARISTAGTSTGVTPAPIDAADATTEFDAGENHTSTEPTYGTIMLLLPLNQRATFRWVAQPGREFVGPATASNGFGLKTPTISTGTPIISAEAMIEEQ